MLCRNPFTRGMHSYSCGQCMPCRFNKRREWAHRIMLEASQYGDNTFLTLTYSESSLPLLTCSATQISVGDLRPKHLQDWLKRFRWEISPLSVRYYAVGEYGDETQRPHYHVALFNYPSCRQTATEYSRDGFVRCCEHCKLVHDTWGHGRISSGALEIGSAQYVAGYVTKKMTRFDDPRLNGRQPEFARMSRRPGIGVAFMHEVASTFLEFNLDQSQPDVPSALRHGKRTLPLGRHLRRKLREFVGKEANAPQATIDEAQKEMLDVYTRSRNAKPGEEVSPKKIAVALGNQKVLQMETKSRIFKERKKL